MKDRYILIGGVPFRGYTGTLTYTGLTEVGRVSTQADLQKLIKKKYDECGGLFHIFDLGLMSDIRWLTSEHLATLLFQELEKDGWGDIDSHWFKLVAEGNHTEEGDHHDQAEALSEVLDRVVQRLKEETPIDRLKNKYDSESEHLQAIEDALVEQFQIADRDQVRKAVYAAFDVGHKTTTTDDWADMW